VLKIALPLLLTILCTQAFAQAPTSTSPPHKVAVVDSVKFITAGIPKTIHERERFLVTFTRSMGEKGWTAIEASTDGPCSTSPDCLPKVGQRTGSKYVLRITGEGNLKLGYTLHLDLYSSATTHTQRTTAFCDICGTDRMAEIASDFTLELVTAATKEEQSLKAGPIPIPTHLSPPVTNSPTRTAVVTRPPLSPVPSQPSKLDAWLPWTMIGVGALGMAYGGWALHKNGDCSDPILSEPGATCHRIASNGIGALAMTGGGLLFLAGTLWEISASLSASPNHVALNMRF
jgi:hypothetical protein